MKKGSREGKGVSDRLWFLGLKKGEIMDILETDRSAEEG